MLAMLLLLIDSEEDQRKFEELYHRYKQLMFHVSRDYFHTESAVEDAVQEAFIRIIKNFSKIGEINCPQTKHFIVIVVRSTCIDLLRTGKGEGVAIPWEDVPEVEAPENLRPGAKLEEKEAYGQLVDVMTLRHLQKLPLNQISSITGFSVDYVKKILQRGKKKLEKALEEMEGI